MKSIFIAVTTLTVTVGVAQAQSMDKHDDAKQQSPGSTGAMQNAPANGVATDPQQVQAQQGSSSKASPGTVGGGTGGRYQISAARQKVAAATRPRGGRSA